MTPVTVNISVLFLSQAPQAGGKKTRSQDLLESKAKWAITLRWGEKRSLICAAEGFGEVHTHQATLCLEELC